MKHFTFLLFVLGTPCASFAQNGTHTGCVQAWADAPKTLVMAEGNSCFVLTGKQATARLKGHLITMTGTLTAATSTEPQSIAIERVGTVGDACSDTCTPEPPGHRGLTRRPKPGPQGVTPGAHDPSTPPVNP